MVATENDGGGGAAAPPMRSAALPILYQHAPGKSGVYAMLYFELCANFFLFFFEIFRKRKGRLWRFAIQVAWGGGGYLWVFE